MKRWMGNDDALPRAEIVNCIMVLLYLRETFGREGNLTIVFIETTILVIKL
jgi:hypothetical protein